jgi:hypothetical protein
VTNIRKSDGFFAFKGILRGKLYLVDFIPEEVELDKCLIVKTNMGWLWLHKLAQVGMRNLHKLQKEGHILGLTNIVFENDRPCGSWSSSQETRQYLWWRAIHKLKVWTLMRLSLPYLGLSQFFYHCSMLLTMISRYIKWMWKYLLEWTNQKRGLCGGITGLLWQNHIRNEGFITSRSTGGFSMKWECIKHTYEVYKTMVKVEIMLLQLRCTDYKMLEWKMLQKIEHFCGSILSWWYKGIHLALEVKTFFGNSKHPAREDLTKHHTHGL